eukprot:g11963.t1
MTEQDTPWLKYQRNMHQRTGLKGYGTRRRRRRLGTVSSTTASASATAGVPVKGGTLSPSPAPSPLSPAATGPASEGLKAADGRATASSSGSSAAAAGDQVSQTAEPAPASVTTAATSAEESSQQAESAPTPPSPPSTVVPRSPQESSSSGGAGGSEEKERECRKPVEEEAKGKRGAHSGNSSRKAGLEEKLVEKPDREPQPVFKGHEGQSAPSHRETSSKLGNGDESGDGGRSSGSKSDSSTAATAKRPDQSKWSRKTMSPKVGEKTRRVAGWTRFDEISHHEKPGSAWNNVHAKKNLRRLLTGLGSDYGVKEMLAAHHISEKTLSKLLPMFQDLVLNDPFVAFHGKGCQRAQKAISKLCYHDSFAADAVLMKKPIQVRSSSGRTVMLPGERGRRGRRGRETGFAKERNDLVEHLLIPRLVHLAQAQFPEEIEVTKKMNAIVDLRNPHQAYPLARLRKRRIIYHGGPTNSGKTYQAIERLKRAGANRQPGDGPAGLFCGPLRLLALEVYEQLNSQGVYCNLNTGQEKREVPFATHVSCTIEMASTEDEYEVAVVDEIQMLADEQRGSSWTAAVLGLNCPEIHVCGGMEGAALVEAMAKETGDDFEMREYQRKTKLVCAEESLGSSYKNIEPGDAVVAFSRRDIFNIKREIESKTPHKCCVIFGSLPQETRAHQARLFNTEDTGYDVLVASDAIGMGLNLNIRRVVFHAVVKRRNGDGRIAVKLPPTMLKQIGGRAGRHGKQWEFGEVTCLRASDMAYMTQVMNTPIQPLPKAAIFPSVQHMQEFSNCLDQMEPEDQERRRLAETYAAFAEKAKVGDRYFLGDHDQYQALANALHPIENLTLKERYAISMAPISARNALLVRAVFLFASAHAAGQPVFINMQLPQKGVLPKSMSEFQTLCSKHSVLDLYNWMGVRFPAIECFAEKSVADLQRLELESIINEALKGKIEIAGQDSISTPEHDTFEKNTIRALTSPKGHNFFATGSREARHREDEDEDEDEDEEAAEEFRL